MTALPRSDDPTPYSIAYQEFQWPFEARSFQREAINELAYLDKTGIFFDCGLGKSFTSTVITLLRRHIGISNQTLILIPPIIDASWMRFLDKVKTKGGRSLSVLNYRGSPAQRRAMKFDTDIIIMSMQIFKNDIERIEQELGHKKIDVILDEAHCIKNVGTSNHKLFRDFTMDKSFQLLTGTPLNMPLDGYAYVKLIAPPVYRSLAQFKRIHIEEVDFFGNPTEWKNLDLLQENLSINSKFARKEDHLADLPPKNVIPMYYNLDAAHLKLYRQLVDAQLLQLPDGKKIDATQAQALRHALGQVVLSWDHFSGDDSKVAKGFDLIEEVLDEIGDKKLVVFANYRRSNAAILNRFHERFGAVAVYGDVSPKDKSRNIAKFLDDPKVRLITLQPKSGGVGVDGLQDVCHDCLFIEPPITPMDWNQALSRLWRDGQRNVTNVRMGVAQGTLQVRGVVSLAEKEELVNPIQYSKAELRDLLLGS